MPTTRPRLTSCSRVQGAAALDRRSRIETASRIVGPSENPPRKLPLRNDFEASPFTRFGPHNPVLYSRHAAQNSPEIPCRPGPLVCVIESHLAGTNVLKKALKSSKSVVYPS